MSETEASVVDLQHRLAAAEARFSSIINVIDDGVVVISTDGTILHANQAAESLLGCDGNELCGEHFGRPVVMGSSTHINTVTSAGDVRHVELKLFHTIWQNKPAELVMLHDATDHRDDLGRVRDEVRRRDDFISMLSHEIRNPLAAISNASTVLSRASNDRPDLASATGVIERQFKHLSRMLDELLDVARVSRGKLTIQTECVDARLVVHEAVGVAFEASDLDCRDLVLDVPDSPLMLDVDPMRLQQVIVNLILNSVRYSEPDTEVRVTVTVDDGHLAICVSDDGDGIEAAMLHQIFEPFVQSSQAVDRKRGGLGVGLALARSIVSLHGGTIEARSDGIGCGSTFNVRLPGVSVGLATTAEDVDSTLRAGKLKILLVEDTLDVRLMLKLLLESDGHRVIEADDGLAGWILLRNESPDVALVDIGLPGINGYEIAAKAETLPNRESMRMVALTGYGRPEDRDLAIQSGFDDHLVKPVDFGRLDQILSQCDPQSRPVAPR